MDTGTLPLKRRKRSIFTVLFSILVLSSLFIFFNDALPILAGARLQSAGSPPGNAAVMDLEKLSPGDLPPFLRDMQIKGLVTLRTSLSRGMAEQAGTVFIKSEIVVQGLFIAAKKWKIAPGRRDIRITLNAGYDLRRDLLDIELLEARFPAAEPWTVRGQVKALLSRDPVLDLKTEGIFPVHEIKDILSGEAMNVLDGIDITGLLSMSLAVKGHLKSPSLKGVVSVKGTEVKHGNAVIRAYNLTIPVKYEKHVLMAGDILVNAGECAYNTSESQEKTGYRLDNVKMHIPSLEYRGSGVRSGMLQISADSAALISGSSVRSIEGVLLKGILLADLKGQWIKFRDLVLDADVVKNAGGYVFVTLRKPFAIEAEVHSEGLPVEELARRFFPPAQEGSRFDTHGTGGVRATLNIVLPDNEAPRVTGEADITLRDSGFSSHDETIIAEGISMNISTAFEFLLPLHEINFTMRSDASGFELLAGKFYGNFANRVLDLAAEGNYKKEGAIMTLSRAVLDLSDTGRIVISGDAGNLTGDPFFDGEIVLEKLLNREAYNFFVRETYKEQYPFLSEMEVDGVTAIKLSVKGTRDAYTARGDITVSDMNITGRTPDRSVQGIDLSLPVNISYPEAVHSEETRRFGVLRVRNLSWASLGIMGIEAYPSVWENTFLFREDVLMHLFGGSVAFRDMSYKNMLRPERELRLAVDVDRIALSEVSRALDIPEFRGTLSGSIPSVLFAGNRLLADGEINLKVFDGSVRISGLSANRVFSPVPSLKCSIDIEDLDLGQLTGAFDFGHISGIIRGNVSDLVIVKGQAQAFNASLESVRKGGVRQKISVQALKKISILGSGTSTSVLDRGIYRFFKEYRYKKLGFRGFLRNDNLLLLGIDSTDGKSYLVNGGLIPPRVDVINYNQNISFQEMVRRLKRITQISQEKEDGG